LEKSLFLGCSSIYTGIYGLRNKIDNKNASLCF
jgi:hypothetical protein